MDYLSELYTRLRAAALELELRRNEPLDRYTTFRVGGPAALMALPKSEGEVRLALRTAAELGVEPFFLGNGSNLLVADEGYPGFIVKLSTSVSDFVQTREVDRGLEAGGAIPLPRLANAALDRGLTGLEFASGIPGSLGGAVTMNAGAYGGELCQVVESVTVMDRQGNVEKIPNAACKFSYRHCQRDLLYSRATERRSKPKWTTSTPGGRRSSPWNIPAPAPPSSGPRATSPPPSLTSAGSRACGWGVPRCRRSTRALSSTPAGPPAPTSWR